MLIAESYIALYSWDAQTSSATQMFAATNGATAQITSNATSVYGSDGNKIDFAMFVYR